MALADRRPPAGPRVLTIDLERLPGEVELDVWEPRDFQRINYVHPDRWSVLPSTLCFSAKWYGEDRMMFAATWQAGGHDAMIGKAWELFNEADAVCTFNGKRADEKWLKTDWAVARMVPPSPWKSLDLFAVAKREFSFESKSLRHLCDRLGIENKDGHYSAAEAKRAAAGHRPSQARLKRYNAQDVVVTELALDRLGPWVKEFPHHGLYNGTERCCYRCGSEDLRQDGFTSTGLTLYARLQCADCGAWNRLNHRKASVTTRVAR